MLGQGYFRQGTTALAQDMLFDINDFDKMAHLQPKYFILKSHI